MSRFSFSSTLLRRCFGVLTLACLVVGSWTASPVRAQQVTCAPNHIVQPGENLFRIALAAGTSWPYLMQLNGITDANLIYVGEVICLPGSTGVVPTPVTPVIPTSIAPTPTVAAPATGVVLPPAGVFPTIDFNTHSAAPGDTLTLTGVNFPTNSVVDVYLTPLLSLNAYKPIAQTTTSDTGTISFALAIPTTLNGVALQGNAFSVLVKTRTTGYYGFNFFYNSRGF